MKSDKIKKITLEDIQSHATSKIFCTQDILFTSLKSKDVVSMLNSSFLHCMLLMTCTKGSIHLRTNKSEYTLKVNDYAIIIPGTIIHSNDFDNSNDYEVQLLGFSYNILRNILHQDREIWDLLSTLHNNLIIIKKDSKEIKLRHYRQILQHIISLEDSHFKNEAINHIFSALLCEIFYNLSHALKEKHNHQSTDNYSPQAYELFHQFIKLLSDDKGAHHSVNYFAEKLCCTPQYFYKKIKSISGKTPTEIIDSFVIELIKEELLSTEKSNKEIAADFNFPTPSFFGTFFKRNTGVTPLQFRKLHKNQQTFTL